MDIDAVLAGVWIVGWMASAEHTKWFQAFGWHVAAFCPACLAWMESFPSPNSSLMHCSQFNSAQAILDHTAWMPDCGCMIWLGDRNRRGYGLIQRANRRHPAHRLLKEFELGRPLQKEELALHKCDTPSCCRPDHIWIGTAKDNMADMYRKGRAKPARGFQKPNTKIRPEQANEMVAMRVSGMTFQAIADHFHVAINTVQRHVA